MSGPYEYVETDSLVGFKPEEPDEADELKGLDDADGLKEPKLLNDRSLGSDKTALLSKLGVSSSICVLLLDLQE